MDTAGTGGSDAGWMQRARSPGNQPPRCHAVPGAAHPAGPVPREPKPKSRGATGERARLPP
eukprot:10350658-Alexandrium_andersonii.AAC.1